MFHYTIETEQSVDEAIASLEKSLKEEQFGVLWRFSIQDKLNEKGIEFKNKYTILEVCNPHEAKKVLNENMITGYFLPCKMAVYEQDGKTMIGLPRPTAMMSVVGQDSGPTLQQIALDVEQRLIRCMDKSKHDSDK